MDDSEKPMRSKNVPVMAGERSWRFSKLARHSGTCQRRDSNGRCLPQGQKSHAALRSFLRGEFGINGLHAGVPVVIGAKGVEKIVEIKMDREEKAALNQFGQLRN